MDYRTLQQEAKKYGIKANQKREILEAEIKRIKNRKVVKAKKKSPPLAIRDIIDQYKKKIDKVYSDNEELFKEYQEAKQDLDDLNSQRILPMMNELKG